MAPDDREYIVYHAETADTVDSLWWGLMQELDWDRSHQDLPLHWHVTPKWPVVAAASQPDQPVGLCSPFVYDNGTGWLGFFILRAEHRGKGWGGAVFQAGLDAFRAAGLRYVGLDAVPEQKATYERRGFREVSSIRVMVRVSVAKMPVAAASQDVPAGYEVVDAAGFDQARLVEYEEKVTGFRRSKLWSEQGMWKRQKKDITGFVVVKHDAEPGEVVGLAVVMDCQHGYRLGPVYAGTRDIAAILLDRVLRWTSEVGGEDETVAIEANLGNTAAIKLFEDYGWADGGVDYSRMWIDGKATPQQTPGGQFFTDCWAEYDAGGG